MQVTKLNLTEVPVQYQEEEGCVAFQLVKIDYSFYGNNRSDVFDTKILKDGRQVIIEGNGFIKTGTEI